MSYYPTSYEPIFSSECVRVVCGGIPETTELLRNKFDYIFYTGSGNVGKIIGAAAAKNITPCTLELGGKSPVYMDESCDMKMAAKRLIWGKTCNGGQVDDPGPRFDTLPKILPNFLSKQECNGTVDERASEIKLFL